jgi:uncharacterized protein (UPF0261 family)
MAKTVVLVGALDTKGEEFAYVKALLKKKRIKTIVVDFGVMGEPAFQPDITRREVCAAGGGELERFRFGEHKDEAMQAMATGLAVIVRHLHETGMLDGIIGMGGSGGTSIATRAMRTLPVGVPKLMVSTIGGGDVSAYAGTKDITFMPSIVDVAGFNRISRNIYTNAAGAIAGMVSMSAPKATAAAATAGMVSFSVSETPADKPLIVASMFGNTTKAVDHARGILEQSGYEVLVFHATGTGGKTMESLIADGLIAGLLDMTTTELADEVCGGVFSAGPDRCWAASKAGIPAVLVPGCVDMANFWGVDTVPEKYKGRNLYQWNPNVTLLRTNVEENVKMGKMIAAAANAATAPVAIVLPLKGVSQLDSPGGQFWDPEADRACYDAIKQNLKPGIPVIEVDHNINDPEFSGKVAETLLEMSKK